MLECEQKIGSLGLKLLLPISLLLISLGTIACQFDLTSDEEGIASHQNIDAIVNQSSEVSCSSCHQYIPESGSHKFHLLELEAGQYSSGQMTCADCHSSSIQTIKVPNAQLDTIELPQLFHLVKNLEPKFEAFQTEIQKSFGPLATQEPAPLLTTSIHNDGKLQVKFPKNLRGAGDGLYHKGKRSCGACHGEGSQYRW